MDLEPGSTRLYRCGLCGADTPHRICSRRGNRYAVVCTNCAGGALVGGDDLLLYQVRWEEELRQILEQLAEGDTPTDDRWH
ncbi:MAG TPA: hypothetical protein VKZ69_08260 [Limnochordales bacterium]|nr:hypothetical protein [Limnochordales bacterium]